MAGVGENRGLVVKMQIEGAAETLVAFRRLPKEASKLLRVRTLELSQTLAQHIQGRARADSEQSALLVSTVRAQRDRVPAIVVGGAKRVGRRKVPAYKILFGAEFGASQFRQFRRHRGRRGYWFFRAVDEEVVTIGAAWRQVADEIMDEFARDSG